MCYFWVTYSCYWFSESIYAKEIDIAEEDTHETSALNGMEVSGKFVGIFSSFQKYVVVLKTMNSSLP